MCGACGSAAVSPQAPPLSLPSLGASSLNLGPLVATRAGPFFSVQLRVPVLLVTSDETAASRGPRKRSFQNPSPGRRKNPRFASGSFTTSSEIPCAAASSTAALCTDDRSRVRGNFVFFALVFGAESLAKSAVSDLRNRGVANSVNRRSLRGRSV